MSPDSQDVLEFWFGALDADGRADKAHTAHWWSKDADFDQSIRARFGALHAGLMAGDGQGWLAVPRGCLAHVIVLDQFSRNMFRGTPASFGADTRALLAAVGGIDRGFDRALRLDERTFLYMPLMHSEQLADQERCVQLFAAFAGELPEALRRPVLNNVKFAEAHRDIVRRFGRFPHRNAMLGRESTAEELAFLAQPGSAF